jgi:RNA polymerase sigma-54 factor
MTPQLRQAIQLLQYTNIEAGAFIEDELLKNPLLERADGETTVSAIEDAAPPAPAMPDATSFAGTGLMPRTPMMPAPALTAMAAPAAARTMREPA